MNTSDKNTPQTLQKRYQALMSIYHTQLQIAACARVNQTLLRFIKKTGDCTERLMIQWRKKGRKADSKCLQFAELTAHENRSGSLGGFLIYNFIIPNLLFLTYSTDLTNLTTYF